MLHGADCMTYEKGRKLIDFSSNINPLGPPKGVLDFLSSQLDELQVYPDIQYRHLKANIAKVLSVPVQEVAVGNGSMELIDAIITQYDRVCILEPCFSEYGLRGKVRGKEVLSFPMHDFSVDDGFLQELDMKGTLVILGNPNNPTGRTIAKETLLSIWEQVERGGGGLLLDEAFHEFVENETYDSLELLPRHHNLHIVRAITKSYGLPGLRLGYGILEERFRRTVEDFLLPWSVNGLAAQVGEILFEDSDYIAKTKSYVAKVRRTMIDGMKAISFLQPLESEVNFILVEVIGKEARVIFDALLDRGFLVRTCSSFNHMPGGREFLRFAVRKEEEVQDLLRALEEIDGKRGTL